MALYSSSKNDAASENYKFCLCQTPLNLLCLASMVWCDLWNIFYWILCLGACGQACDTERCCSTEELTIPACPSWSDIAEIGQ